MLKPMPLCPGPRPPYMEGLVKGLQSKLNSHIADKNDPHETKGLVHGVTVVTELPASAEGCAVGESYLVSTTGQYFTVKDSPKRFEEVPLKQGILPLDGKTVPLDNDHDLYNAVQVLLEKQGATVA